MHVLVHVSPHSEWAKLKRASFQFCAKNHLIYQHLICSVVTSTNQSWSHL